MEGAGKDDFSIFEDSEISELIKELFPSKPNKWQKWTDALADEDIDTAADLLNLTQEAFQSLKLSALLRSGLQEYRAKHNIGAHGQLALASSLDSAQKENSFNHTPVSNRSEIRRHFSPGFHKKLSPLLVLVLGEVGDGKSSLIRHFHDATHPEDRQFLADLLPKEIRQQAMDLPPSAGATQKGDTEELSIHPVLIGAKPVFLLDTPGFGDSRVKPDVVMAQIDHFLEIMGSDLNGILVCKNSANKVTNGLQLVMRYIDVAFHDGRPSKWGKVITVSTKKDLVRIPREKSKEEFWDEYAQGVRDALQICLKTQRDKFKYTRSNVFPRKVAVVNAFLPPAHGHPAVPGDLDSLIAGISAMQTTNKLAYKGIRSDVFVKCFKDIFADMGCELTEKRWKGLREGTGITGILKSLVKGGRGMWDAIVNYGNTERESTPLESVKITIPEPAPNSPCDVEFCALLSSVAYDVRSAAELQNILSLYQLETGLDLVKVINGEEEHYRQPAVVVLRKGNLYIAWRGTDSIMSMITDLKSNPYSPLELGDDVQIKVHAGMWTNVAHDFSHFLMELCNLVKKQNLDLKNVIFSGHSLGGGMAQLALLLAQCSQTHEPKFANLNRNSRASPRATEEIGEVFGNVQFYCTSFAAPMVMHCADPKSEILNLRTNNLLAFLRYRSTNYVYALDVVPRLPGNVDFWKPALGALAKTAISSLYSKAFDGYDISATYYSDLQAMASTELTVYKGGATRNPAANGSTKEGSGNVASVLFRHFFGDMIANLVQKKITEAIESSNGLEEMLRNYRHCCKIVYLRDRALESDDRTRANMAGEDEFNKEIFPADGKELEIATRHLLEYHSVCPNCIGKNLVRRQEHLLETHVKQRYDNVSPISE